MEPVQEEAVLGLEAAPLGVGEARGGKCEGGHVVEGLADALEALLDAGGERAEGRRPLGLGPDGSERIA